MGTKGTKLAVSGGGAAKEPLLVALPLSLKQLARKQHEMNAAWLAGLGRDHAQRVNSINAIYEERRATLTSMAFFSLDLKGQVVMSSTSMLGLAHITFIVSRNLAGMDNRDREYLRIVELLNSAADGTNSWYHTMRIALLLGDGKGTRSDWGAVGSSRYQGRTGSLGYNNDFERTVSDVFGTVDLAVNAIQQHITYLEGHPNLSPAYQSVVDEAKNSIAPTGGGAWLKPADLAGTVFADNSKHKLYIGSFPDGSMLSYSGDGSMVTIAPPGSGKTQCNVFPNLLVWEGPAIVLDISGDIYEHTAAWRAANVGPVYKFNPLDPEDSHKYNPLTFVRHEADYIWEDSRLLAELMIVPSGAADPFWENEARTVLTSAIAYVCYSNPPAERPMYAVLDVLFGGEPWADMLLGLKMAVDVRVMTQHATSLSSMNEKTLSSVLQTARSSLGAWTGERVARVTAHSDWNPLDLRSGVNPTIYISVRPNEVEAYLSLLRVFIGQHIRVLTGGPVPARDAPPILVMLDELPRLRYMAPVDDALNIGRKYNLRLWMFAQSVGQFQTAYPNADGMLGSCAVRIFMNPSGADGLAERLSEELGNVDSLNDNSRRRMVEAADLAGPSYKDRQIVVAMGAKPGNMRKDFAYANPELHRRMNLR
jgi:type IV secretion system protein VirD4